MIMTGIKTPAREKKIALRNATILKLDLSQIKINSKSID